MDTTARINSKLYFDLFKKGGDKLLAVYCILKQSRQGEIKYYAYKSSNNKTVSGYGLLKAKTNLSLNTIKKYVPVLIDMGLCFIDKNGDFVLIGSEKLKIRYSCSKLVPIKIGKNLTETSHNAFIVRLHSNLRSQEIQISKKKYLRELKGKAKHSNKANTELQGRLNYLGEQSPLTDNILLSNKGFSNLKSGQENKSGGFYQKKVLISMGLISSERRFKRIKKISYVEYLSLRNNNCIPYTYKYNNNYIIEELVSKIKILP